MVEDVPVKRVRPLRFFIAFVKGCPKNGSCDYCGYEDIDYLCSVPFIEVP